jgi:hypothetical protein
MQAVESFGSTAADPRSAASAPLVGVGLVLIASWSFY